MKYLKLFEEWHKVVSKKSDSGKTKWVDTILDDPTSSKSLSSGILLKRDLEKEEFELRKNMVESWKNKFPVPYLPKQDDL